MSQDVNKALSRQADAVAHAVGAASGVAVIDAASVIGDQCATCDGFMCLDCVAGTEPEKCTRACPDCLIENADWDESLQMSQIITELRGLAAVDEAIAAMDREESEEPGDSRGRDDRSA